MGYYFSSFNNWVSAKTAAAYQWLQQQLNITHKKPDISDYVKQRQESLTRRTKAEQFSKGLFNNYKARAQKELDTKNEFLLILRGVDLVPLKETESSSRGIITYKLEKKPDEDRVWQFTAVLTLPSSSIGK